MTRERMLGELDKIKCAFKREDAHETMWMMKHTVIHLYQELIEVWHHDMELRFNLKDVTNVTVSNPRCKVIQLWLTINGNTVNIVLARKG